MTRGKIQTAIRLIYPPRCIGCGALVEEEFGLCAACWRETPFIGGLVCDSCGVPLIGPDLGQPEHCDDCLAAPPPWGQGRAALIYRDNARRLVLRLKHADRPDLARAAGGWMARCAAPLLRPGMIVVPVPLHPRRLLMRRYNQAALLAREVARRLGLDCCPDLLIRPRLRGSLDGLSQDARHQRMQGAIGAHPRRRHLLAGRPVLLVDDVMTSGATFHAATRACVGAAAGDVNVLALARVAKRD